MHYTHLIFLNNAFYIQKNEQYLTTSENILKIIKNLGLIPKKITTAKIGIIMKSINRKNFLFTYQNFMDILIKIIEKILPKEYKENKEMAKNYFLTF